MTARQESHQESHRESHRESSTPQESDLVSAAVRNFYEESGVSIALGAQALSANEMCIIEACGLKAGLRHHLRIGSDCGLGGRVFSVQRVMGVTDYLHSQSISHTFDIYVQKEGIRSLAAVPVVVQRKVHAVLYAGARAAVRLPNRILESLTRTARNLEQDIAVLEATAVSPVEISSTVQESEGLHAEHERSGPMWEQVRKAYTRLRVLAAHVSDDEIQRELEEIANLLVAYPRIMPVHLSTREIDVLSCVAMGLTNIEAAAQMGVGPETVKSYLRNCMRKLDVHNRYEAVSSARSLGVIP